MAINEFKGQYRFLSNFWPAVVVLDGITFPSTEHAYQAAKTLDTVQRIKFSKLPEPRDAKKAGKGVILRDDWEDVKLQVMEDIVRQKFSQEPLKTQLLNTNTQELIEGNTWGDTFWGICNGKGENHLGKILMKIRDELKLERENQYGDN